MTSPRNIHGGTFYKTGEPARVHIVRVKEAMNRRMQPTDPYSDPRVGRRCRLTQEAIQLMRPPKTHEDRLGTVIRVTGHGLPVVLWDGQKTPRAYDADYIEIIRR